MPKVADVMKNTLATLAPVYRSKRDDNDKPHRAEKIQNKDFAFDELIFLIPVMNMKNGTSGARTTSHLKPEL